MVKKSVKHFLNLIFTLILSLCFALSFSISSYASGADSSSFVINDYPDKASVKLNYSGSLRPLDDSWYQLLGGSNGAHCSFQCPLVFRCTKNLAPGGNFANIYRFSGVINYHVLIDYMDSNLAAFQVEVLTGSQNFNFSNPTVSNDSSLFKFLDLTYDGDISGTPIGITVNINFTNAYVYNSNLSYGIDFRGYFSIPSFAFSNVSILGQENNDVGKVEIEYSPEQISTNGLMSTNGFSPLILATNGNVRYFGNLGTYNSKFGYPAFNMSDFESGSSAPLTLFEGQYPDNGISNVHPIAFMGDCRKGEYEIVFGFITTNNPVNDQGVNFSIGWTGELVYSQQAFPLFTNDMKYNYRVQYNPVDGYFYNTIWLRFETDREFDSLCIRSGPTVSNLVHGAFCVNKFVGTVADQLNLDNYQWNYQPTNIDQFNQNNSSTGGAINSADSAEQGFFDNYDSAVSSSGIENFNLSVIGNSLLFVQMIVNRFYSILPDKLQYLIFASLVFGVLGAILGVTRYVIKHESRVSRSKASDKKGD